jgi:hypothetical protein
MLIVSSCEAERKKGAKTYNTRYSLVVTHPTANQALSDLTLGDGAP